jgi:hypothetical protein
MMNKFVFSLAIGIALLAANPLFAMQTEDDLLLFTIGHTSPLNLDILTDEDVTEALLHYEKLFGRLAQKTRGTHEASHAFVEAMYKIETNILNMKCYLLEQSITNSGKRDDETEKMTREIADIKSSLEEKLYEGQFGDFPTEYFSFYYESYLLKKELVGKRTK